MGSILYECHFELNSLDMVGLILWVPLLISYIKKYNDLKKHGVHEKDYAMKILFMRVFFCFFAMISIIAVCKLIDMYKKTVIAYRNGDYQIVEGYVENFDPMPESGHKYETFEINGVKFGYSDYTLMIGYHNAKSHGGVITRNGQYFKIGYVCYHNENVIVYIEQYPEKRYSDLEEPTDRRGGGK